MKRAAVILAVAAALAATGSAQAGVAEKAFHHIGQTLQSHIAKSIDSRGEFCRVFKHQARIAKQQHKLRYFSCVPSAGKTVSVVIHYTKPQPLKNGQRISHWLLIFDFHWQSRMMDVTLADGG